MYVHVTILFIKLNFSALFGSSNRRQPPRRPRMCQYCPCEMRPNTDQIVVRFDAKQLPEVAKGQRCVGFQAEIWEMVRWSQVASLTGDQSKTTTTKKLNIRETAAYNEKNGFLLMAV